MGSMCMTYFNCSHWDRPDPRHYLKTWPDWPDQIFVIFRTPGPLLLWCCLPEAQKFENIVCFGFVWKLHNSVSMWMNGSKCKRCALIGRESLTWSVQRRQLSEMECLNIHCYQCYQHQYQITSIKFCYLVVQAESCSLGQVCFYSAKICRGELIISPMWMDMHCQQEPAENPPQTQISRAVCGQWSLLKLQTPHTHTDRKWEARVEGRLEKWEKRERKTWWYTGRVTIPEERREGKRLGILEKD